ncbi:MAG: methyltransferase domain-containing protein [Anaerolineae bacterium]|nr:methyltransferase domain-containing protein [Anaerolineae bacterium]
MTKHNQWEEFFDAHAPHYMQNSFTKNTQAEVDFVLEELQAPLGSWILDMGCGTGRHAVELARRGYRVTGVDISAGMLAEARKAADAACVEVEWVQADATTFQATRQYDGAVCLCEGAFGLVGLEDDPVDHGLAILRAISYALKPGAVLVMTALNALGAIQKLTQADIDSGRFDPATMTVREDEWWDLPEGRRLVQLRERRVVPSELVLMCRVAGLDVLHLWGGTAGAWGRRPLQLAEIEMMVVARKKENE